MSITSSSNKLIALATGVAVALALMGAVAIAPAQAAGLTQTQIQSIVSLLASFGADQGTINNVTAALNGQATTGTVTTTTGSTGGACPALTRDLSEGSTGADVMALQQYLNSMASTQVAASGAGSPGNETQYFGPATQAAVISLQTAWGISPNVGYVGPITRAAIASHCGGTTTTTTTTTTTGTTGGAVSVSAGVQPQNSLAPIGASRVPFTTFTLTNSTNAPVTINSVTVQRTGLGVDANFSGIVLLDQNGLQVGTAQTLNSNHQANIGSSGFTIPADSSANFTVAGNIQSCGGTGCNGQVIALQVVAVNTGASVSGSLPISGASQTVNSTLTLGSVSTTTSSFDPGANSTHNIGDTGVRFSGIRFTAGSAEDLKLYSIRWRQTGSASAADLANVVTVVNGTSYPTTVDSSTGNYFTTTFPGGILIPKGNSVDAYIQGDLVGSDAAGRTVIFNIDKVTDVYFVGQLYGYGVAPSGTYSPWYQGYTTTVNGGTVTTISNNSSGMGAAQNVAINVQNQPLGGFTTNFTGEPVTVNGMTFTLNSGSLATTSTSLLTNVSIVNSNGTVVAGPVNESSDGKSITFTDTVTFPIGTSNYYLEGQIPTTVTGGSLSLSTSPSSWSNPTGQTTGNTVSLSSVAQVTMNSMTIKPATLTVNFGSTPASQSIVAGVSNFTFANVLLDASQSGENVRLASIPVYFTGNANDLSGCQLYNGAQALNTGGNVVKTVNGGTTKTVFSLDNVLVVPKGTITTLGVNCTLSNATSSSSFQFKSDNNTADWSVTGNISGAPVTPTLNSGSVGGTMTVQTAALALSADSSTPNYGVVAGGSTGQTMAVYNIIGSNDTITLTQLGMALASGATANDVTTAYVYNGSTLLGTATFGNGQSVATSTFTGSGLVLPANTNVKLTVKADVAQVGTGKPGTPGHEIRIDPSGAYGTGTSGQVYASVSGTAKYQRLYASYPTITYSTSGGTLANGVNTLLSLNVTASPQGDVGLFKLTFSLATSGVTVASPTFNGPNGQVSSSTSYMLNAAGNTLTVFFDSTTNTADQVVSAGTTKTYTLGGTVSGITGTSGGTVSTALEADSASTTLAKAASVPGSSVNIWSGNSTSTDVFNNNWANSYGLPGCFTSVGLGTNCTANVLAK